ncbi:hypothetical protein [Georgenia sp. SUBG003]|uniref:hypothetical protein n=1 Tax=Georgenia sp. SUBG003 TaxID=1497974 RepID=UPI003AB4BCB0
MSINDATTHLFLHDARERELAERAAEIRLRDSLEATGSLPARDSLEARSRGALAPALLAGLVHHGRGLDAGRRPAVDGARGADGTRLRRDAGQLRAPCAARAGDRTWAAAPCAAMSAASVLAAAWFLGSAPLQPAMAVVALSAVTVGLVQRLTGAGTTCSA